MRHQLEREHLQLRANQDRIALGRVTQASERRTLARQTTLTNGYNGRPEATYLQEKETRAQHAQKSACHRDSEVSALPEHEASAPRLR
jgi:hypothetical protein